jgi:hypothetical protein
MIFLYCSLPMKGLHLKNSHYFVMDNQSLIRIPKRDSLIIWSVSTARLQCYQPPTTEVMKSPATLTINQSTERVYYPSIYLEDLSGNKTLITNNTTKQNDLQTILKATKPNSPKGYLGSSVTPVVNPNTGATSNQSTTPVSLGTTKVIDSSFVYGRANTSNPANKDANGNVLAPTLPTSPTQDQIDILSGNTTRGISPLPTGR